MLPWQVICNRETNTSSFWPFKHHGATQVIKHCTNSYFLKKPLWIMSIIYALFNFLHKSSSAFWSREYHRKIRALISFNYVIFTSQGIGYPKNWLDKLRLSTGFSNMTFGVYPTQTSIRYLYKDYKLWVRKKCNYE